jgi:hypothetical protein
MLESPPPLTIRRIPTEDADALRAMRLEALRDFPLAFTADLAENEALEKCLKQKCLVHPGISFKDARYLEYQGRCPKHIERQGQKVFPSSAGGIALLPCRKSQGQAGPDQCRLRDRDELLGRPGL